MSKGILKAKSANSMKKINVGESSSQIVVIFNEKNTFLLTQQSIKGVGLFEKQMSHSELRIIFVNEKFDLKIFQKVMKHLQGFELQFERCKEAIRLIQVLSYLEANQFLKAVLSDVLQNFQEYSFFSLFQAAQKFNIEALKAKCLYNLINLQFEQMNFNRFDLIECQKSSLELLLKMHQYLKRQNKMKGLDESTIKQIIAQHSLHHHYNETSISLSVNEDFCNEMVERQKHLQKQEKAKWIQFRTPSFDLDSLSQSINLGDRSQDSLDSPQKGLKKLTQSTSFHQNCSRPLIGSGSFESQKQIKRSIPNFVREKLAFLKIESKESKQAEIDSEIKSSKESSL